MEEWKTIVGFDMYEVSNHGRVKSLSRKITRTNPRWGRTKQTITKKEKLLTGYAKMAKNGKPDCVIVALRRDGETHLRRVHSLVLSAFLGDCPEGKEGCHNDGNPLNNHIENLRWDTRKANIMDSILHKTKQNPPVHIGDRHPNAKLSKPEIDKIRSYEYHRGLFTDISAQYSISITHASRIWKGTGRISA